MIVTLGILAGLVQLCDALVGLHLQDLGKTLGPLVIGLANLLAIRLFVRAKQDGD